MMIRMIRPCTLWGKTFEAIKAFPVQCRHQKSDFFYIVISHEDFPWENIIKSQIVSASEIYDLQREAIITIAEALNAPVLATKEVLAGLPDEGEFLIQNVKWGCGYIDTDCIYTFRNNRFIDSVFNRSVYNVNVVDELKENSFEIKAKNEIALAYLLQFYTDGTPVVVK